MASNLGGAALGGETGNETKTSPRTLTFSKGTGNQVMQRGGSLRGDL